MPVSEYYKGSGKKVMASMKKKYGASRGKEVFYATANKQGMKPKKKRADTKDVNWY
jgi:hypothetical protein